MFWQPDISSNRLCWVEECCEILAACSLDMDSCSLVSRHQPKPTHSCPEQKSAFVSVSLSLPLSVSLVVQLGSALHLDWTFVFECAYFGLFNKEKLVLPKSILKSNFQNKGLEGVTTWSVQVWAEVVPSFQTLNYFLNVVVILPISLQLSSPQPGKCSVTNKGKMKRPADEAHPADWLRWHQSGVESQKWTNMRHGDKTTSMPHACHHCPSSWKPCTVVGLVAETWLV